MPRRSDESWNDDPGRSDTTLASEETGPLDRLTVVREMYDHHFDLIRLADHKAQFLLRMTMMLFGAAFIGVPPSVIALKNFLDRGGWPSLVLFVSVSVLYMVCATSLLMAITKVLAVVRPRVVVQNEFPTTLFFTSVAAHDPAEFRERIQRLNPEQLLEEMMGQAYQSSVIARHKFATLDSAVNWMFGGGIAGFLFALILLVSSGLS